MKNPKLLTAHEIIVASKYVEQTLLKNWAFIEKISLFVK